MSTSVDVRPRFSHSSLSHLLEVSGAGVPLTSPQLYSSCHTDDLRQALLYISHRYPRAPLLGLGFSLGANVLTRYVAEEGEECRLVSACALACVSLSSFNNVGLLRASAAMGSRGERNRVRLCSTPYPHFRVLFTPLTDCMAGGSTATSILKEWVGT